MRLPILAAAAALALSACGNAGPSASGGDFTDDKVVLAVLNDASGVYKDVSGPNGVKAVEMAVADYKEKFANPYSAAERGYVDDVIEPRRTRPVLIDALETTLTKAEPRPRRKHGNIPL